MPVHRTCQQCGGAFLVKAYQVKIGKAKYCSPACTGASFRLAPLAPIIDGATARIPLSNRQGTIVGHTIVDVADLPLVSPYGWRLVNGYARSHADGVTLRMHRLILRMAPNDLRVPDHINRDKLDNRRSNLRILTKAENGQNLATRAGARSKHRGVIWNGRTQKWMARVKLGGQTLHLGSFSDEEVAADAVRQARLKVMPYATD